MNRIREFGGFFGLEAGRGRALHANANAFGTACGALQHYLSTTVQNVGSVTIWMPAFLCPQVEVAVARAGHRFTIRRYRLGSDLEPLECDARPGDIFYFYNVFGLKGASISGLPVQTIVDNAHAFFEPPVGNRPTFYSARKFFGVPDGAYLYCCDPIDVPQQLSSSGRFGHLLKRIEQGPAAAYQDFRAAEQSLSAMPPSGMSTLAQRILESIDYDAVHRTRLANFGAVHAAIGDRNELAELLDLALEDPHFVPFSYPFLRTGGAALRETLIAKKIYVPHLWSGLADRVEMTAFERHLADDTVHLPIDQRYQVADIGEMLAQGGLAH